MVASQDLPDYENPPVVEVVCGVLFKPIDTLLAPYVGLLWEKFKPEYPHCQEVPPLEPVIEHFGESPAPQLRFTEVPPLPRIWFIHADDTGIIQIQRDRFLHNWRKRRPEQEYPRYHAVIEMFRDRLSRLRSFLSEAELGTVEPLQYEMTYINHIPQGEGWNALSEIGNVFPDFNWQGARPRFLPELEGMNWRTAFVLPERAGRLYVTIRRVVRRSDGRPILLFELTARGIGEDRTSDAMWAWFDLAREWIVRGFTDLTGEGVQKAVWRRKR